MSVRGVDAFCCLVVSWLLMLSCCVCCVVLCAFGWCCNCVLAVVLVLRCCVGVLFMLLLRGTLVSRPNVVSKNG